MLSLFNLFVQTAHAADIPGIGPANPGSITPTNPTQVIGNVYTQAFNILTVVAGALAIIYLVWFGIQYITSAGNADKAKQARAGIINAIVGIVIIISAYAIIRLGIVVGKQVAGTATSSSSTTGGGSTPTPSPGASSSPTATPTTATLTIKTLDATGKTLANATVNIGGKAVTTNSNGTATITVPISSTAVTVSASGSSGNDLFACQQSYKVSGSGSLTLKLPERTTEPGNCNAALVAASPTPTPSATPTPKASASPSSSPTATPVGTRTINATLRTASGLLIPGAFLEVNGGVKGKSGSDGKLSFSLNSATDTEFSVRAYTDQDPLFECTGKIKMPDAGTLAVTVAERTTEPATCGGGFAGLGGIITSFTEDGY